eukprot:5352307-Pleurochrysis_carterae.AAC.1
MVAGIEEWRAKNQRLCSEITKLKGITEPGKDYFHHDGFTLAADLAIAEPITTSHVSCNQVPALFLIFANLTSFAHQAANPRAPGAAEGCQQQGDSRRDRAALRPRQDACQG